MLQGHKTLSKLSSNRFENFSRPQSSRQEHEMAQGSKTNRFETFSRPQSSDVRKLSYSLHDISKPWAAENTHYINGFYAVRPKRDFEKCISEAEFLALFK